MLLQPIFRKMSPSLLVSFSLCVWQPDMRSQFRLYTYFYPFMIVDLKDDTILAASTGNLHRWFFQRFIFSKLRFMFNSLWFVFYEREWVASVKTNYVQQTIFIFHKAKGFIYLLFAFSKVFVSQFWCFTSKSSSQGEIPCP